MLNKARVEIYTAPLCLYCIRAKSLLANRGVHYVEYDVGDSRDARFKMSERANGNSSVPQIFIDGNCIGGSDELAELDRLGKLEDLLNTSLT
ncbi:Glutaredoxin [Candidatus Endolissoclinum faulkneri L2]|uniref:Glutaredoxin n=1 Tax=Candidatus Endolissoclinum faulkneri L2 TaxID=1193729 RepID=K7YPT5_9PROT|nr:glutaredoxin 3 [Candidatus Endolissoclinum faulkneri]AFX98584.1 Glutaredoxin [Candidatus Endolissoclinum faulkneri L2]